MTLNDQRPRAGPCKPWWKSLTPQNLDLLYKNNKQQQKKTNEWLAVGGKWE